MPQLYPDRPVIGGGAIVDNASFGACCEIGAGARILNSRF